MRSLDFHKFAETVVPGTIALIGVHIGVPQLYSVSIDGLSLGGFAVLVAAFVVAAYVTGYLTQAFGRAIESVWWLCFGGVPTDWVRTGRAPLLSDGQLRQLDDQLRTQLHVHPDFRDTLTRAAWFGLTRQIYAMIAVAGRSARADSLDSNSRLSRGIGGALILLALAWIIADSTAWPFAATLLALAIAALGLMHGFAKHYARELFMQFLKLPTGTGALERPQVS